MACLTGANGQQYCDAERSGLCSREKQFRHFLSIVSFTDTGRIVATGPCETCGNPMTVSLYNP